MSSTNFEFSTRPSELDREAAERLKAYVDENWSSSSTPVELPLERALRVASPTSSASFARIIQLLVDEGILRRLFRVYSTTRAGLKDFDSVEDIPFELFDYTLGYDIEVNLDNVMVILKVNPSREIVGTH